MRPRRLKGLQAPWIGKEKAFQKLYVREILGFKYVNGEGYAWKVSDLNYLFKRMSLSKSGRLDLESCSKRTTVRQLSMKEMQQSKRAEDIEERK